MRRMNRGVERPSAISEIVSHPDSLDCVLSSTSVTEVQRQACAMEMFTMFLNRTADIPGCINQMKTLMNEKRTQLAEEEPQPTAVEVQK